MNAQSLFISLLFSLALVSACGDSEDSQAVIEQKSELVGEWEVYNIENYYNGSSEPESDYDSFATYDIFFVFNSDFTGQEMIYGKTYPFVWSVENDNLLLDNGVTMRNFDIVSLSFQNLIISLYVQLSDVYSLKTVYYCNKVKV